uniref:Uncharacterized protein n=1 Tax=Utricularia reniformis TaxID=192314 RepID=A0A1Y0B3L7_9LAMI|nr:hypothetical protein AEK19_MT1817 [Utricularia reniformis]ART31988.1 hypothetical protein AEK19_MT1817 [Utricularia reniformis]
MRLTRDQRPRDPMNIHRRHLSLPFWSIHENVSELSRFNTSSWIYAYNRFLLYNSSFSLRR